MSMRVRLPRSPLSVPPKVDFGKSASQNAYKGVLVAFYVNYFF